MNTRIAWLALVAVVSAVAVVLIVTLRPATNTGAQVTAVPPVVSSATPDPTPSPVPVVTHGQLAYERNGGIYLANWDGSDPVRIADGGGEGHIWSPDGRYLAYRGEGSVNISDAQGHHVTSFPGEGWQIAWSPDSTRVATWQRLFRTIGVYGLDGVRQDLLTLPDGLKAGGDHDPVWSPDGASLMVPEGVEIPLNGSMPHHLPPGNDPRGHFFVWYSPDGTHIAYEDNGVVGLAVADADGSRPRVLTRRIVSGAAWSPTGDRLALTGGIQADGRPTTGIRVFHIASGRVTTLTATGSVDRVIGFSPDGARILFSRTHISNGDYVSASLWSIGADGTHPQRLVAGSHWGEWQPGSPTK